MATQQFNVNPLVCGGANGSTTQNGFSISLTSAATVTSVIMSFAEQTPPPTDEYMLMWTTNPPNSSNSNIGGWTQQASLTPRTNVSFPISQGQTLYFVPAYIPLQNIPTNGWLYYNPVLVSMVPPKGGITNTITCNPIESGDSTQLTITLVNAGGGL